MISFNFTNIINYSLTVYLTTCVLVFVANFIFADTLHYSILHIMLWFMHVIKLTSELF